VDGVLAACELSGRISISAAPELEYQKPAGDNEATDHAALFLPLQFIQQYITWKPISLDIKRL
jgi:hypothetical protein